MDEDRGSQEGEPSAMLASSKRGKYGLMQRVKPLNQMPWVEFITTRSLSSSPVKWKPRNGISVEEDLLFRDSIPPYIHWGRGIFSNLEQFPRWRRKEVDLSKTYEAYLSESELEDSYIRKNICNTHASKTPRVAEQLLLFALSIKFA